MAVTIKDVAKAAQVSVSTVSKVINGHYSISEETAARVKKVMRELNYYPNASAQSFAKGATHRVVLLTDLSENMAFQNPHMFEIISGLEEKLRSKGYELTLVGTDFSAAYEKAEEIISRKSADALAIHVSVLSHPLSALLTRMRFPHMVLGMPNFESQVCWIDINNVFSGVAAAAHLVDEGYKTIAFIGGHEFDMISSHRLSGLRQGLADAGFALDDRYVWLGESTRASGYRLTKKLLETKPLPDAVVCANNYIALGCVGAIDESGLKIPEDIGVMTFDDYPFSQIIEPNLTVVDINVREMGKIAGRYLIDQIRHPNTQVQTYTSTPELIVRKSTMRKK